MPMRPSWRARTVMVANFMTRREYGSKIDELEALLNDPDVPLLPDRVWTLLAEVAGNPAYDGEAKWPPD